MKLIKCKFCEKSYPKSVMENKDYCSKWCIENKKLGLTYKEVKTGTNE